MSTAVVEVGAMGIGTLIAASLLDFTGLIGVGALAATGFAILPYKRSAMKKALNIKIKDIQKKLQDTLASHFSREMDLSLRKLQGAVEPYTRFVKVEQERLGKLSIKFINTQKELAAIREAIHKNF
jgi:hypothetical protein